MSGVLVSLVQAAMFSVLFLLLDRQTGLLNLAVAAVVLLVVSRTYLSGDVSSADAIVLFLALRLLSGQLGTLSSGIMRFARAAARRGQR